MSSTTRDVVRCNVPHDERHAERDEETKTDVGLGDVEHPRAVVFYAVHRLLNFILQVCCVMIAMGAKHGHHGVGVERRHSS